MPTPTYTPLATVTLASAVSSLSFSSIPSSYRDLILVCVASTSTSSSPRAQVNSDSGSNYSFVRMSSSGSSATSGSGTSTAIIPNSVALANSSTRIQMTFNFMDYSATDKHKTILIRTDESSTGTEAFANRWASTSAITSIYLFPSTGTWSSGSTFSLYGVIA
jgi:hypothetical protein